MKIQRPTVRPFSLLLALSWFLSLTVAACGKKGLPGVPGGGGCPNLASGEGGARVDFAHEFKLKADGAHKLEAGVEAAVELKAFAHRIDADLQLGFGGPAPDHG